MCDYMELNPELGHNLQRWIFGILYILCQAIALVQTIFVATPQIAWVFLVSDSQLLMFEVPFHFG